MDAGLPSSARAINADIPAAKKIQAKIGDDFARYGMKQKQLNLELQSSEQPDRGGKFSEDCPAVREEAPQRCKSRASQIAI